LDQGEARIGKGVRQRCSLSPIIFNSCSEYLTREAVEGDVGLEIGGQVICSVKYADDLMLLAKKETVLQSMTGRLIEVGRCC
jgi:hypothetical protein